MLWLGLVCGWDPTIQGAETALTLCPDRTDGGCPGVQTNNRAELIVRLQVPFGILA